MHLPHVLEQTVYGHMASHCLFAADEIGLFRALGDGTTRTSSQLASDTDLPPEPLERLLLGLTAIGILSRLEDGYVLPHDLRPFLDPRSSRYCGARLRYFRKESARLFPLLAAALRHNAPQWNALDGGPAKADVFDSIYVDQDRLGSFVDCMWNLSWEDETELVGRLDLGRHQHLVDVGGCTGSFAIAALLRHATLQATVLDRAQVRDWCFRRRAEFALESRLEFVAGDFLSDAPLPEADVYSVGYILSDWSEHVGTRLLQRLYSALPSGGALVVLEKLFDEDKRGPLPTAMMNLCMLLEQHGKHRSAGEYVDWLKQVGFREVRVLRSQGEKHAIVGTKEGR